MIPGTATSFDSNRSGSCTVFKNCTNLTTADLSNLTNTTFGNWDSTFEGCTSLTSVTLPSTLTQLGYTFQYCSSLENIDIPDSVTIIGANCFNKCNNLKTATVGPNCTWLFFWPNCPSFRTLYVRGNSSCTTAQTLQNSSKSNISGASVVYLE
jgi:hypothetical protein